MLGFVAAVTLMTATATITPTELREQLAQPVAVRYQQQIERLPNQRDYHGELDALVTDPQVSPAAREWLLHAAAVNLRAQPGSAPGRQFLQTLQQFPSQVLMNQDFEGRLRALPLAPVAAAATTTLTWWQQQEHALQIRQHISAEAIMATAAHWSKQTPDEQAAWLLAVQEPTPDWSARLASIDRVTLAKQAPALAASIATQLSDTELAAALLRSEHSEIASQLLANVPQHFADNPMPLYEAALSNKTLRSQSWFQLAKLDDYQAQSQLRSAAAEGERSAIAAWLQQQGEQTLPDLQRWLASKTEKQQLTAIYALRLLATPGAQQLLSKARSDHRLSARARQELQP